MMAMRYLSWKCVLGISIVAFIAGGILALFDYYENHYQESNYSSNQSAGAVSENSSFQIIPYDSSDYATASAETHGFITFSDYYWGFELNYPENWTLEPSMSGTFFTSPYENTEDVLLENASLAVENLFQHSDITLHDYAIASLNYLNRDPAYSFVEQGEVAFGGYEGWYLLGIYDVNGQKAGVRSLFTLQKNRAYIFTYMYEMPGESYERALIESMIGSFVLIPGEADMEENDVNENVNQGAYGFTSLFHFVASP